MVNMENAEEVMQILERFTRLKQKEIPKELDDYLQYVAKTGDTVFKWASLKYLFREKLLNVIKHFHDTSPRVDEIPQYPNVDPFNYESMKSSLLERLELFNAAPFTIQRLCELLIDPRKQYSRIDKFMRALEKNILVVSTIEPGRKRTESENGDSLDSVVNGDLSLDVNVDIDMENESLFNMETQNGNGTAAAADGNASPEAETKEKPSSVTESTKHAPTDDDILPNPKKVKLDLAEKHEKDAEKTEAEESTAELPQDECKLSVVDAKSKEAGKIDGEPEAEVTKSVAEDAEMQEDDNKQADLKEKEKQQNNETPKKEEQMEEKTVNKTDDKQLEKNVEEEVDAKSESKSNNKNEVEKKVEAAVSEVKSTTEEVDAVKKNYEKTVPEAESKVVEEEEKIIEKQEFEKGEKEVVVVTVAKPSADLTEKPTQSDVESQGTEKPIEPVDVAVEDAKVPVANGSAKVKAKAADQEIASDDTSKADVATSVAKEENTTAPPTSVETETVVTENALPTETLKDATEESDAIATTTKEVEKVESKSDATAISEKSAEAKADVAAIASNEATVTAKPASDSTIKSAKDESVDAPVTATEQEKPAAEDSTAASDIAATECGVPSASETVQSTTADSAIVTETSSTSASADSSEAIAAVPAATPTPTPTPTLALNDHPMDDVPLEEVHPAIDEVVMADTNAATEMATDANEPPPPSKDEPAGMEVDDTSQEAMDQ